MAPLAVSVVLDPVQIATSGLTETIGTAFTVSDTVVVDDVQAPRVTDSVIFFVPAVAQFT